MLTENLLCSSSSVCPTCRPMHINQYWLIDLVWANELYQAVLLGYLMGSRTMLWSTGSTSKNFGVVMIYNRFVSMRLDDPAWLRRTAREFSTYGGSLSIYCIKNDWCAHQFLRSPQRHRQYWWLSRKNQTTIRSHELFQSKGSVTIILKISFSWFVKTQKSELSNFTQSSKLLFSNVYGISVNSSRVAPK